MDSIIEAATAETIADFARWAIDIWHGREPDTTQLDRRLNVALTAGAMGGVSTSAMDDMVGEPATHRHLQSTDEVFRLMVTAIAKKKPTLGVLSPRELAEKTRQTAFFVSGVLKSNALDRIRKRLIEARVRGLGQSWFVEQVAKENDLAAAHIANVFRTNVESAAGAARWKQLNDPDVADLFFGYRYVNPNDSQSRPLHRAMHGFCALKEDPIWRSIWTPNGYQCRCKCRGMRRHQALDAGLIDENGRTLRQRVFSSQLQEAVVHSIENGTSVIIDGKAHVFPDEGFRGNALMDLL